MGNMQLMNNIQPMTDKKGGIELSYIIADDALDYIKDSHVEQAQEVIEDILEDEPIKLPPKDSQPKFKTSPKTNDKHRQVKSRNPRSINKSFDELFPGTRLSINQNPCSLRVNCLKGKSNPRIKKPLRMYHYHRSRY